MSNRRSFDGSGNNVANPEQGAVGTCLISPIITQIFSDGEQEPVVRGSGISARAVSNSVSDVPDEDQPFNARKLTNSHWQWGQLCYICFVRVLYILSFF